MGTIKVHNRPCINPNCNSHDAMQIYEEGDAYCFSCQTKFEKDEVEKGVKIWKPKIKIPAWKKEKTTPEDIEGYSIRGFQERKISKRVAEYFGVKVSYGSDGEIDTHYYPYDKQSYKVRKLPKHFSWINKSDKLFGQMVFNAAGKRLIITEGEIDAMSVAQAYVKKYDKIYPVVSMASATMTKTLIKQRDWIRSFKEVVICFDEDEAGEEARKEAIRIIGVDKVKLTKLPKKDANQVLVEDGGGMLLQCIWDAAPFIPSGIITKEQIWKQLCDIEKMVSVPYAPCLEGVNSKLKGKRKGEIVLFISGTGSGKSTILREDALYTKDVIPTEEKIGIVSLEESPAEFARKLSGMMLMRNPADEEIPLEELKVGFDQVFEKDRIMVLDHQGSMDDISIIDKLEYMCLSGCSYIYIDHITLLAAEGLDNLTGNEAQDRIMGDLLRLVKRHPVWIGLVSHLRKTQLGGKSFEEGKLPSLDDIRGSGSVKQISFDVISFARNLTAENEKERNTIKMRILKSRHTGLTGVVPGARYTYATGRLTAMDDLMEDDIEEFTEL